MSGTISTSRTWSHQTQMSGHTYKVTVIKEIPSRAATRLQAGKFVCQRIVKGADGREYRGTYSGALNADGCSRLPDSSFSLTPM